MGKIIAIASVANNRAIGKNGDLAVRNSEDMKFFTESTTGHPCIMGKITYESINPKYRPLKDRTNIIVTSNADYKLPILDEEAYPNTKVLKSNNIGEAVHIAEQCSGNDKIFLCGGASIYDWSVNHADELWITEIPVDVEGADTFFPEINLEIWKEVKRETSTEGTCVFVQYIRI